MRVTFYPSTPALKLIIVVTLLALVSAAEARAQSTDIEYPSGVFSDEISGRIAPLDIGDARTTRHFYIFQGLGGNDLTLSVQSSNLNGDIDIFTASSLRPLMKITVYAGASASSTTKSVFLRESETLILRVEGRAAGDTEATYRIRFAGAFAPATAGMVRTPPAEAAQINTPPEQGSETGRLTTSSGARIPRPPADPSEIAAARRAEEAPAPRTEESRSLPAAEETEARAAEPPARPAPRARTPRPRASRPAATSPRSTTNNPRTIPTPPARPARTTPSRPAPARRRAAPAPAASGRLIIELRDGTRLEREMSEVRRVTVENGQLILTALDGTSERQPMANVLRVSIEPFP